MNVAEVIWRELPGAYRDGQTIYKKDADEFLRRAREKLSDTDTESVTISSDMYRLIVDLAAGKVALKQREDLLEKLRDLRIWFGKREAGRKGAEARWSNNIAERTLRRRGLQCVLREDPSIAAATLRDWLEDNPRTYDDDDIELRLYAEGVVIRDLSTDQTVTIPLDQLSTHINRTRSGS